MLIRGINDSIQRYLPSNAIAGKYSPSLHRIASNLNKFALPIIALYAFSSAQTVLAGPLEYSACILGCTLFATPAAFPGCAMACLLLLPLPTP